MTYKLKTLAIAGATAIAMLAAPNGFAADNTTNPFAVKSTTEYHVRAGVDAFKKGDYTRSVQMNQMALKRGLSKPRRAVAHANLCASHAMIGDLKLAEQACDIALNLRPDLKIAVQNKAALNVRFAQNLAQK